MKYLAIALALVLSACAKQTNTPAPECSGPDFWEQTQVWPDGVTRKSDVYHCNNGQDLIYNNANRSQYFWR